jgi:hypothetical protein
LLRKAFRVGEEGLRVRGRYVSTVDLATLIPSLWSSPTMRGEPHVGLASPHVLDELADVSGNGGATRLTAVAETSSVIPEPFLLPGDDGPGLHERQRLLPARP